MDYFLNGYEYLSIVTYHLESAPGVTSGPGSHTLTSAANTAVSEVRREDIKFMIYGLDIFDVHLSKFKSFLTSI